MNETETLLLHIDSERAPTWAAALKSALSDVPVRIWPELGDPDQIRYALLWKPPSCLFDGLHNLQVIFSVGAGIDHLLSCTTLPAGVPVVRMVEPVLTAGMVEYVIYNAIRFHRRMHEYEVQQRKTQWQVLPQITAGDVTIGIMGLGVLGEAAAAVLTGMNYRVTGWSRSRKYLPGVQSYVGQSELLEFLSDAQILVMLLPLDETTQHILNKGTLAQLPRGACVINAGRGGLIHEHDLLNALDNGHISGAALDVFETEPLPEAHLFWRHPNVTVTPHAASLTNPVTAVQFVAENIRRHQNGKRLKHIVAPTDRR
jgi:glyoxylate/hydroxypyruvate reductase A